jgi:hypothetical protein
MPEVGPEVVSEVVPVVVPILPVVVPVVVVLSVVLPEVEPLVEPAFSEVVQALKTVSDAHSRAPVNPESQLRFIGLRKSERDATINKPLVIRASAAQFTHICDQKTRICSSVFLRAFSPLGRGCTVT